LGKSDTFKQQFSEVNKLHIVFLCIDLVEFRELVLEGFLFLLGKATIEDGFELLYANE
jgi:hypothetical protein